MTVKGTFDNSTEEKVTDSEISTKTADLVTTNNLGTLANESDTVWVTVDNVGLFMVGSTLFYVILGASCGVLLLIIIVLILIGIICCMANDKWHTRTRPTMTQHMELQHTGI